MRIEHEYIYLKIELYNLTTSINILSNYGSNIQIHVKLHFFL